MDDNGTTLTYFNSKLILLNTVKIEWNSFNKVNSCVMMTRYTDTCSKVEKIK
jgi:hypothetical protein